MKTIENLSSEIYHTPIPKGLVHEIDDIDIDLYAYDSYVMGLASSYLAGSNIKIEDIHIDRNLSNKFDKSIEIIIGLRDRKKKLDELAELIINALNDKMSDS
ncbi:MAG: hypothetical protein P4L50_28325 [Anaerolineaceae bacterium]|nr:hypothetical protein [Anaerolineaceae bacterium]